MVAGADLGRVVRAQPDAARVPGRLAGDGVAVAAGGASAVDPRLRFSGGGDRRAVVRRCRCH